MEEASVIKTSICNDCGRKGPGIEHRHEGYPVLFVCKYCEPVTFEKTARTDIDRWLSDKSA